jgi:hypothetical protein
MESKKFICHSKAKVQYDWLGNPQGMGVDRALYYSKSLSKERIYRSSYPKPPAHPNNDFELFKFSNLKAAQDQCDSINNAHNDDFSPFEVTV